MFKTCRNCQHQKPIEDFPHFSTKEAGRKNTCKECSYKLNKLRQKLKQENPEPSPGSCPICNNHTEAWILDHCHFTDSFRGYVCNSCNLGLGRFNDDVELLQKAINYLKRNCVEDYQI
jgi:protein-arginine kinase activator protein McsA